MSNSKITYTGLHQHSVYSALDGFGKVEDIVLRCKELGMKGVCITDHGNMAAAFELWKACKKHDMKPIFANEMYLAPSSNSIKEKIEGYKPYYHIIVIAKNNTGYRNLMRLTSDSWLNGKYYKPRTSITKLSEHKEGLIVLSACLAGFAQQLYLEGREEEAVDHILEMRRIFGDDYYLEVQYSGLEEQEKVNEFFKRVSEEYGIGVVITSDAHYVHKEDSPYHQALVTINTNGRLDLDRNDNSLSNHASLIDEDIDTDESGLYYTPGEYFIKSVEDFMACGKLSDFYDGFALSNEIADRCNVDFFVDGKFIPSIDGVDNADEHLKELCLKGLDELISIGKIDPDMRDTYVDRLMYELDIIKKMEFSEYFLVVSDYVQWAKRNGIMVGGGRGSAGGSLVAYTSRITNIDPIRYGLLFERFLSRGRAKKPLVEFEEFTFKDYQELKHNSKEE